jgi:hypothetical protein
MNNPIHAATFEKEKDRLDAAKGFHLPIHVTCVLDEYSDFNDSVLHQIRDHCKVNSVLFTTRIYDSDKYSCDRDFIERLPALHVYIKQGYIKTWYPNTRPLQHVDEVIETYMSRLEGVKKRKGIWRKRFGAIVKWFKNLTRRKTRMERYQEEKAADWEKRRHV